MTTHKSLTNMEHSNFKQEAQLLLG